MKNNAIFHFYGSLYLLILGALIMFHLCLIHHIDLLSGFTSFTALWEALPPTSGFEQNYDIVPFEI